MANEPGSDYGYDLVHEDVTGAPANDPRRPANGEDSGAGPPSRSPEEPGGDYGYDEAHDF